MSTVKGQCYVVLAPVSLSLQFCANHDRDPNRTGDDQCAGSRLVASRLSLVTGRPRPTALPASMLSLILSASITDKEQEGSHPHMRPRSF